MAQKTTKPIREQRAALTKRQEMDVRTKLMSKTSKVLSRIVAVAAGEEEMTAMEFKASELLLRKTLPDLSAVAHVEKDDLSDMSRDELLSVLGGVLESQPHLAEVPAIREAVNSAQTVNTINGVSKVVDDADVIDISTIKDSAVQ